MRLGWLEILVIVVLVVVLFGSAKIPGMMHNLANGINVFKKELKDTKSEKSGARKSATAKSGKKAVKK